MVGNEKIPELLFGIVQYDFLPYYIRRETIPT